MATAPNGTTAKPGLRSVLRDMSSLFSRQGLAARIGSLFGDTRRVHQILGYKAAPQYLDFKARYERQDIAKALVDAYPEATWAQAPKIVEDHDADDQTPFEAAWESMATRLDVLGTLERADRLAQLGRYSIVLIGLRGQPDLAAPAQPVRSPEDVVFLTPYSEEFAEVIRLEGNPALPTFGRPAAYRLNAARGNTAQLTATLPWLSTNVHASRVVHIANNLLDDDIYGKPVLEVVYDRLDDLLKVVGGSAEMFWVDAKRRIVLAVRDDYALSTEDEAALTTEIEEFTNEMRNFLRVKGVDVNTLTATIADPSEHFNMLVILLAAASGIPKRILIGTEEGQLAGQQDERAWLQRVSRRQVKHVEPKHLRPLIDAFLALRALPEPVTPYRVEWPNLLALSATEQATIAREYAAAISNYAGPGMASSVVPEGEFRETYLNLPAEPPMDALDVEPAEEEE